MILIILILVLIFVIFVVIIARESANTPDLSKFTDFEREEMGRISEIRERGESYFESGDYRNAIVEYDRLLKYVPGDKKAYLFKAMSKFQLEDYEGALNDFDDTVGITGYGIWLPYEMRAKTKLKLSYMRDIPSLRDDALADFNYAIYLLDEAIEKEPENGEFYLERAGIKRQVFNNEEADKDVLKAAELGCSEAVEYLAKRENMRSKNG